MLQSLFFIGEALEEVSTYDNESNETAELKPEHGGENGEEGAEEEEEEINCFDEFLECICHLAVYYRNIYPSSIFDKHTISGIPVKRSIHPSVSDYIETSIETMQDLVETNSLRITSFAIIIASDKACEKIVIETDISKHVIIDDEKYVLELNDIFRGVVQRVVPTMNKIKHRKKPTEWWIEITTANYKLPLRLSNDGVWIKQKKCDNKFIKVRAKSLILPILTVKHPYYLNVYIQAKGLKKQKVKYADQDESE